jgi:hypothetical protein
MTPPHPLQLLRIENRPICRDAPTLHIIHHFGRKPLITDDTHRLRTTFFPQLVRQQGHIRFALYSRIPNYGMRIRRLYAIDNLLAKCFFGIRGGPEDAAGHFLGEDDGETGTDAGTSGDENDRFEECCDAQDAAGGDTADVDLRGRPVDGPPSEVACAADDEGEATTVGIGYRGEAMPRDVISRWTLYEEI